MKKLGLKMQRINGFVLTLVLAFSYSCKNTVKLKRNLSLFKYNEHKNISTLDPAFSKDNADNWAVNQLFNGLVQMNENLEVTPCIAKDWQITNQAKTYRFILRNDVRFHKHHLFGKDSIRHVTAYDFEYSFKRLQNKKIASPGSWVLNKVNRFYAENDTIFNIQLKQPFPAFLGLLTMKYCSVVPKEIVKFYGTDFRSHPIGTGPFKFKRWEENIKLVFRKNNAYFETDKKGNSLPYLEAVAITFLPDKQSEFLQFAQGNIDFISGLDDSYKDDILTAVGALKASYANRVNMIRGPYLNTEYLGFFMDSDVPEIRSKQLRQAINYGFDRHNMITYLRNGIGIPANGGFIPKGLPGHNATIGYRYNIEKAKALLKAFKEETGINRPKITISTIGNYLSFSEYIQRELEKIGIEVAIDVIPASALKDAKANGRLPIFRASWVADYPDAENYVSLFYSKNFTPNGPNYTHYKSTTFDTLYQNAFLETNTQKRALLYTKMDSLLMQEAPVIPLFYDEAVRFTQKNVQGLGSNAINMLDLKRVKKIKF